MKASPADDLAGFVWESVEWARALAWVDSERSVVAYVATQDVVVARVRHPVWLCGNDAVVVSPGGPGAAPLIFVPFLAEQTEWHSQLPESLPAPPAVGRS